MVGRKHRSRYGRKEAQVQVWLEECTGPGMVGRTQSLQVPYIKEAKDPGTCNMEDSKRSRKIHGKDG
jgi:hypothetical protein